MLAAEGRLEKLTFLCLYMERKHTKTVLLMLPYHLGNASRIEIHTETKAFP